jgi:hypothetical protein
MMLDSKTIADVVDGAVCVSETAVKGAFSIDTRQGLQAQWYIALRVWELSTNTLSVASAAAAQFAKAFSGSVGQKL